jgi:serine/threonine-protein kinase
MPTHPGLETLLASAETILQSRSAARAASAEAHPERLGRYEVRGLLGEGAMGRVFRAHDPLARREVAIKVLKPPFASDARAVERFRREALVAGRLSHPALVAVFELAGSYLVQELVEGESLADRLARAGALAPPEALRILEAMAGGLDHVHARGIVHRDVKPSNVMLVPGGGVKITDFGVAHLAWAPLTRTGEMIGSPAYMAPEQIAPRGEVKAASDIYALGVVAYECLTGTHPFRRASLGGLLESIVRDEPAPASAVDGRLPASADAALVTALAKDPAARYPSCRAFVAMLRAAFTPP